MSQAAKLLDGLPPGRDSASRREELRDLAIAALALPDLEPTGRVITRPSGVIATAFDPTMTRYALRFRDGTISVRRVADDQEIARFQARGDRDICVFGFSPDGRYLATTHYPGGALTVWDVDRRAVALDDPGPICRRGPIQPGQPAHRRGHRGGELLVYDLATGRPSRRGPGMAGRLAFRPDGAQIAVIDDESNPPTCRILDAETGRLVRTFPLRASPDDVAWSPDGTTLATPRYDHKIDLWDAATGTPAGDPRRPYQSRLERGLPPSRHAAGQQRLGRAAPALGPDPGPAPAERDERTSGPSSAATDGSSFRTRTS